MSYIILKTFFEHPSSELWLFFIHAQLASFHQAVQKIEGQNISAIEAANEINQLNENLAKKQTKQFLPFTVRRLLKELKDTFYIEEELVKTIATEFYRTSREYLDQWTVFNEDLEIFD
ncbi:hypothetical protein JTB14_006586 [Gonioctena quinquepunctata]|nr:hypothetical protein JTB14_006586 [Gonioctena quinquepunctata]